MKGKDGFLVSKDQITFDLREAEILSTQGKFQLANGLLKNCYQQKKSFRINYLLFSNFLALKDYSLAVATAEEYLTAYIADDDYLEQLFWAMGKAALFLKMRKLFIYFKQYMNQDEKNKFRRMIDQAENQADQQFISLCQSESKKISFCPVPAQRRLAEKMLHLPLVDFLALSKEVIAMRTVHPLLKSELLDNLRALKIQTKYGLSFLNGENITVIPSNLHDFKSSKLRKKFAVYFSHFSDQQLAALQKREVFLKLQLLYPFEDRMAKFNRTWLAILLGEKDELVGKEQRDLCLLLETYLSEWDI
ncbi:hypothetical protein [Liquorilactobacillus sicerae]|uniref:hypothetical protein n=1 Tax=Liquorilactobacillus sicerae TaxID=1416943 RepID=UPI002481565E|nr:hypothetical protein [Liquorilactobacillus sicerae]